jgi:hypothetical protein
MPPLVDTINTTTDIWIREQEYTFIEGKLTPTYSYSKAGSDLGLLGPTFLMVKSGELLKSFISSCRNTEFL